MRRLAGLMFLFASLPAMAGSHDFYECTARDGTVSFSVERCAKGEKQRRVEDDRPPLDKSLGAAKGGVVRLESGGGGHFYATVQINGMPVKVVVDTGATTVSLAPSAAARVGLDTRRGVAVKTQTANGVASATGVMLDSVELNGNVVRNVPGLVTAQEMGPGVDALLGMTFLKHFEVNTDGYVMTLRPK